MRGRNFVALLACALPLGGCAYIGLAPAVIDAANNSRNRGYVGENFEESAVEACTARGSRYGRVTIGPVERVGEKTVRVGGVVQEATRERPFTCDFRSNGRIAKFRI